MSSNTNNGSGRPQVAPRYHDMQLILGDEKFEKIRQSKVLVVGAGGIGCELLKNLVLSGFENIEIIDLDTIDVSNLNRQFLFRQEHVGKSKSIVARESALKFNPQCNIVAHHSNVKHETFNLDYFKQFSMAMNALDNADARRHVNRMCLAADIPLVDGGTSGYLGQVITVKKHVTPCYECVPPPTQKSFAVCTIRSNPSTILHCVAWAKLLFERIFGKTENSNAISDLMDIINNRDPEFPFAKQIFTKVFDKDIAELLTMKDQQSWNAGVPPESLDFEIIMKRGEDVEVNTDSIGLKDRVVWSLKETVQRFSNSALALRQKKNDIGDTLSFDKDDDIALEFVTAAANLRAFNFHIPNKSQFDIKAMAGNIVPAIATTNAVISAAMVLEAIKVLNDRLNECKVIHRVLGTKMSSRKNCIVYPMPLGTPNPDCYACSSNSVNVVCNTDEMTLGYFVKEIMTQQLGLMEPMITVGSNLIYECGEGIDGAEKEQYDRQLQKWLKDVNIVNNAIIEVEDFVQDIVWQVKVFHSDVGVEEFKVHGKSETVKDRDDKKDGKEEEDEDKEESSNRKLPPPTETTKSGTVFLLDEDEEDKPHQATQATRGTKRDREEEEEENQRTTTKRQKQEKDESDVILLD